MYPVDPVQDINLCYLNLADICLRIEFIESVEFSLCGTLTKTELQIQNRIQEITRPHKTQPHFNPMYFLL